MLNWRLSASSLALLGVFAATLATCLVLEHSSQVRGAASGDDWRRSAHGWERTSRWPTVRVANIQPQRPPSGSPGEHGRHDTHPIVLAFVQLVGTLLALYAWPSRLARPVASASAWPAIISRSFRASVFGC